MNAADAPARILVVDDTEANRYVLTRLLNGAGYRTLEADCGEAALQRLADGPDLVVLDVHLPDMLGYEVCRRIKATPHPPKVMQASASFIRSEDRVAGLEGGADAFLVQPLEAGEFLATVRSLLRLHAAETGLREANRELERSNRDLEHFAHLASHDLQEPLRMVASFIGLLEAKHGARLDEQGKHCIARALDGTRRMGRLIHDLMALAHARGAPLARETFPAQEALQAAFDDLAVPLGASRAAVRCDPLPAVHADRVQLARVFQNLLSNAVKFAAPERPLEIAITCIDEGDAHRFAVADNGIGIPSEARSRIFEMFTRLRQPQAVPGSGIGLSAVRSIIERHDGRIGIESEPGQGATFWFTLPKAE